MALLSFGITVSIECVTILVVVTLKAGVISHKKEALQPLSVRRTSSELAAFRGKVIDEPMNGGGDLLVESVHLPS